MDKIKVSYNDSKNIGIDIKQTNLKVNIQNQQSIGIDIKNPNLKVSGKENYKFVIEGEHKNLKGLDFESSGHTGFASEKQISLLRQSCVPKDLSILPEYNLSSNRKNAYIYIDNNGTPQKVSARNLLSTIIRTSDEIPNDLQVGEYLFLERD